MKVKLVKGCLRFNVQTRKDSTTPSSEYEYDYVETTPSGTHIIVADGRGNEYMVARKDVNSEEDL